MHYDKGVRTEYKCLEIISDSENKTHLNVYIVEKHFLRTVFIDKCRYYDIMEFIQIIIVHSFISKMYSNYFNETGEKFLLLFFFFIILLINSFEWKTRINVT